MTSSLLANLAAYSGQLALIIALAALALAARRIDAAGVRSLCLRGLLLLCLALPWIQPRQITTARVGGADARVTSTVAFTTVVSTPAPSPVVDWTMLVMTLLGIGIAGRLAWIAAGLWRLRVLRRSGTVVTGCPEHDELQRLLGTRAEIRSVPDLGQPVTFGTLRPVVLLPEALHAHSSDVQRAVLAHELFHVQRHDSAWLIAEEILRALFWFHPAMWWLISRVQLAREEVVDELVVLLTSRRKTYAEALVAFADDMPLAPLAAFARRRHLIRRVSLISREGMMSSRQIVSAVFTVAMVVAVGGRYVVQALPLQQMVFSPKPGVQAGSRALDQAAPGPVERRAVPVTPENPVPRRIGSVPLMLPPEAAAVFATAATATLTVTIDDAGRVVESRVTDVTISNSSTGTATTSRERETPDADQMKRRALDAVADAATAAVRQWRYDPPAVAPLAFAVSIAVGSATPVPPRTIEIAGEVYRRTDRPGVVKPAAGSAFDQTVLRVGGNIKAPAKIRNVPPVYPPIAMTANVQGIVIIEARIEPDGTVSDAQILKSIPLLDQAALDAVRQWQFAPTLLNGAAVPVMMTLTVNFSLAPHAAPGEGGELRER